MRVPEVIKSSFSFTFNSLRKNNSGYIIISLIWLMVLFILMYTNGTTTFADAMRGYEALFQYSDGAPFNTLNYPSVRCTDYSYYIAWWSPGQWFVPYLIMELFDTCNIQCIQSILIFISLLIALAGYFSLFEKLGFKGPIVHLSMLCLITNQLFYWHTFMYYGGDLFLFALTPFFILNLVVYKQEARFKNLLILFALSLLGLFFKNTFTIFIFCSLIYIVFSKSAIFPKRISSHKVLFAFSMVILLTIFFILHLSKGQTPGSAIDREGYNQIANNIIGDFSYPIGSPFGIFSRFSFIVQKSFSGSGSLANTLHIIPCIALVIFVFSYLLKNKNSYSELLLLFCLPFLFVFTALYLLDRAVSYEMRHFAPVAFLFFPGIIQWIMDHLKQRMSLILIIVVCLIDLALFTRSYVKLNETHVIWQNFKLTNEDASTCQYVSHWDQKMDHALIIFENYWLPSIAVRKNDKIVLQKNDHRYDVLSGIELSQRDRYKFDKDRLIKYNSLLFLTKTKVNIPISYFKTFYLKSSTYSLSMKYHILEFSRKKQNTFQKH